MYYINERLVNLHRIFDQNKREGYLRLDLKREPRGAISRVHRRGSFGGDARNGGPVPGDS